MANGWQLIGLILALELIFASLVAVWTRWAAESKLQGQTIWHVVVGVAGVVVITGPKIGWEAAAFVLGCFVLAFFPMAIEYFSRLRHEELEAQKLREESVHVNTSSDRQE